VQSSLSFGSIHSEIKAGLYPGERWGNPGVRGSDSGYCSVEVPDE
jgi:hypothetical protein